MAQFYADENFDNRVVVELRILGFDVLTVPEAGKAGDTDAQVAARIQQAISSLASLDDLLIRVNRPAKP